MFRASAVALLVIAAPGAASPAPEPASTVVRFLPGTNRATLEGAVVRGQRTRYLFRARQGQRAAISISAPEDNAVFELVERRKQRETMIGGPELRRWAGTLPAADSYVIVVGGTRGNATYRLDLRID